MKTIAFGEILWDIINDQPYIGGAPFNVAAHLAKLGASSYIISALGKDQLGNQALKEVELLGINSPFINQLETKPTGTVDVFLQNGQPAYTIHEDVAWDAIQIDSNQMDVLTKEAWDVFIFGTLAQRTPTNRVTLQSVVQSIDCQHFFVDVNLRAHYFSKAIFEFSLQTATILKLNEEEAPVLSNILLDTVLDLDAFLDEISTRFSIPVIIVTHGAKGAAVFAENKSHFVPTQPIKVADTVGAGDSFSAAFIKTYLTTSDPILAAQRGCQLGGFVASSNGAIPAYSEAIKAIFNL